MIMKGPDGRPAPFFVVEGVDGSGKTSQVGALCSYLAAEHGYGVDGVCRTVEPRHDGVGLEIRESLQASPTEEDLARLPFLFALDRHDHLRQIRREIGSGRAVVCDRYVLSSMAYQSDTMGMFDILALNSTFPLPLLTLYLDCPVHLAVRRIQKRSGQVADFYDQEEQIQKRVHAYRHAIRAYHANGARIAIIPAGGSIRDVSRHIQTCVREALKEVRDV